MKAEVIGERAIKIIDSILSNALLVIVVALTAFAFYALWDSNQVYSAADKSKYESYKPTDENEGKTFKELQAINPEVIAWLEVYGTNIDYPVTQGEDNMKYVNTNAECAYSLSGAIFLDADNSGDFSDFNNILHGHHMEKNKMFGEIGGFSDEKVFDSHRYGNLYYGERGHGIEFFAFVQADAYDGSVYSPGVGKEEREAYLANLTGKALCSRDVKVTGSDRIVLLSTCSTDSTNGRDILVGKITGEVFDDPFKITEKRQAFAGLYDHTGELCLRLLALALGLTALIVILAVAKRKTRRRQD